MKHIAILALIAVAMLVAACGQPAPVVEEVVDSLTTVVDSLVVEVDTALVQVDSAAVVADSLVEVVVDSAAAAVEGQVAPEAPVTR